MITLIKPRFATCGVAAFLCLSAAGQQSSTQNPPAPPPGLIASDSGGAPGYQHGLKQSHFLPGKDLHTVTSDGWSRQAGANGAFAVSLHNGVAMALPNARPGEEHKPLYTKDPSDHERQVRQYFISAGIPENQIGGTQTMTRLSSSGHKGEAHPAPPRIESYISVLERTVDGFPVPDSVAWAQLDDTGHVVSEGVYWPAIPASILREARQIRDQLVAGSGREKFLAHVPGGLPSGRVAIRHSSAAEQQSPFEALASYDVIERRASAEPLTAANSTGTSAITRHFDKDGAERKLPQERRNAESDYPAQKKTP